MKNTTPRQTFIMSLSIEAIVTRIKAELALRSYLHPESIPSGINNMDELAETVRQAIALAVFRASRHIVGSDIADCNATVSIEAIVPVDAGARELRQIRRIFEDAVTGAVVSELLGLPVIADPLDMLSSI